MYEAKIILDSVGPNGARLTTFELQYPRFVHAELMTHRVFSRNSASSRAIPTERLLERIGTDPVLPVRWGRNQSGMQAREELTGDDLASARAVWLRARNDALDSARFLGKLGLHKQIANRVVEPWMFITVVVTATELSNFFALRDHADAQPELADVAGKAHRLWRASSPRKLESGQYHLPYVNGFDQDDLAKSLTIEEICKVSIGRCAAVSYLNQDRRDPPADLARADKLENSGHMSPFEHVAQALTDLEWEEYAEDLFRQWVVKKIPVGNLWGWRQYRKTLYGEHDFTIAKAP